MSDWVPELLPPLSIIRARTNIAFTEKVPQSLRAIHAEAVVDALAAEGWYLCREGQAVVDGTVVDFPIKDPLAPMTEEDWRAYWAARRLAEQQERG